MAVKLQVADVCKTYQIPVIRQVSFQVEEGEFVCILGPNGCGKTTLLRIIGGLERPTSGGVVMDGRPLVYGGADDHKIGVVFQEDRLLPWLSLKDNVALILRPRGLPRAQREEIALSYLHLAGLQGFEGYYPNRVSGGMRQRAAIARALAIEPDLLLMDEPFGALDAQNRRIMQDEVRRIWRETKKTVLFVTHSIEEAVHIGTTLIVLSARPAQIRELIRNNGTQDRHALIDGLHGMIMEEVLKQQGK